MKKRYSLGKTGRILLGLLAFVTITTSWLISAFSAASKGQFAMASYSATLSFIGALLIMMSKEHSETVILGLLLNPLVLLVQGVFHHSFWWPNLLAIAFSAFIIFSLFRPINKKIIKIISILYIALLVFLTVRAIITISISGTAVFSRIILAVCDYVPQIAMVFVFVLASYEDADVRATDKTICTASCAVTLAFVLMHLVFFIQSEMLLQGHQYGNPDKYGDYARGLYSSEVMALDGALPNMLLIVGVLVAIQIICAPMLKRLLSENKENKENKKMTPEIGLYLLRMGVAVCAVGTVWVAIHYGMYS